MSPARLLPCLLMLLLCRAAGADRPAAQPPAAPAAAAPCTPAEVQKARAAFRQADARKDYQAAADGLTAFLARCPLDSDAGDGKPNLLFFWVRSDLSYALYKLGRHLECLRLLAPLTTPKPPDSLSSYGLDDEKVGKAIRYNEDQCQAAFERPFAAFSKAPCRRGKTEGAAIGLPKDLLPPGAADACLELGPAADTSAFRKVEEAGTVEDQEKLCPRVALWSQKKPGGPWRKAGVIVDGGPIDDPSVCCHINGLSAALVNGKRLVRVEGSSRNCFGGTADTREDAVYEWTPRGLVLQQDNSVASH